MNKLILFMAGILLSSVSCEVFGPCSILENRVYSYPDLPVNHNMTKEEVYEYRNLPQKICKCISTEGLVETCLNYPNWILLTAYNSPQAFYDLYLKKRFRGISELESRSDRGDKLLQKYKTIDPLDYDKDLEDQEIRKYLQKIAFLELIISQYHNLRILTLDQKIELINEVLETYDRKKNIIDLCGTSGLSFSMVLAGRLMYSDGFAPFVKAYEGNANHIAGALNLHLSLNLTTLNIIYEFSSDYLQYLKK